MNPEDKPLAEAILRHLCIGRRICGVLIYATPTLTIDTDDEDSMERPASLRISAVSRVLEEIPPNLPELDFQEARGEDWRQPVSELLAAVAYLGWHKITAVRIGDNVPHLLLTFSNGQTLYINGHDRYECWEISDGSTVAEREFWVVGGAGDVLQIWCPEEFWRPYRTREASMPSGLIIYKHDGKVLRRRSVN